MAIYYLLDVGHTAVAELSVCTYLYVYILYIYIRVIRWLKPLNSAQYTIKCRALNKLNVRRKTRNSTTSKLTYTT